MPTWKPNVKKYPLSLKSRVMKLHCRGKSRIQIGEDVGYSLVVVNGIINHYSKERNDNWKVSKQFEKKVVSLYVNTLVGSTKLSRYLGENEQLIHRILKRNNVKIRRPEEYRKHDLDEDFFENINNEKKAYWLGFLLADGCNSRDRAVKFALSSLDEDMVEAFKKDIKSTAPIYRNKGLSTLTVHSRKFVSFLKPYGFIQNKTQNTFFPNIPESFHRDFIRGYFDGDGSVSVFVSKGLRGKTISAYYSIAGTEELLMGIQDVLIKHCNLNKNKLVQSKGIKILTYGGTNQVEKIYHYLYDGCTVFMDRKRKKIYDFLTIEKKKIVAEYKLR